MRPAVAIAILAALPLSAALADVYRSVDAQGHVLYSDTPTPGSILVRVTNPQQARALFQSSAPPAAAKPTSPPAKSSDATDQIARQDATRSVQADVASNRADQCKKATDVYEHAVSARRIYNEMPNGERTYLSDEQADAMRVNAKLAMDEACKT
jgi:hypothetical protein